jgi:hypothetical protein
LSITRHDPGLRFRGTRGNFRYYRDNAVRRRRSEGRIYALSPDHMTHSLP